MSHVVVGVIGHVDHGKTALVRALTGCETDRLPEERKRGISIALGFAHGETGAGNTFDLIDMPGHERFVRTMVGGATGIDAVLLVVAANEGICPQTLEHARIAALLGIGMGIVAVTKADRASPLEAARVASEAEALLGELGIAAAGSAITSAICGTGMDALPGLLDRLASTAAPRSTDGLAFLPIDRAFTLTGHGSVVTGTLRGAPIMAGEPLCLLPGERRVRLRGLQVHGHKVDRAVPGQRVAVNLRGVELEGLGRGMALARPDQVPFGDWLSVAMQSLPDSAVLANGARVLVLAGSDEIEARLRLLEGGSLEPGSRALAQLRLSRRAAIPARERFILRLASPACTIGGGAILETGARRLRRHDAGVLARLSLLRDGPPNAIIMAEIASAGQKGVPIAALSQVTSLAPWKVAELLAGSGHVVGRDGTVLARAEAEQRARLRPRVDPLRAAEAAQRSVRVAAALREAGLLPPTPRELETDREVAAAIEKLLREGELVRTKDRAKGKEMIFHRDAIADARRILAPPLLAGEGLSAGAIASLLGISRKFAMPLLDHLDAIDFTRREGDLRWAGRLAGRDGGSGWESNPPPAVRGPPVLKTGEATRPLSLPRRRVD